MKYYNISFRSFEWAYMDLDKKHVRDIAKDTGCIKPCKYKKYRLDWEKQPMPETSISTDGFGLAATSNYTTVGIILLLSTPWLTELTNEAKKERKSYKHVLKSIFYIFTKAKY